MYVNAFESRIASIFRKRGHYTIVSASSRGIADVIAIKAKDRNIRMFLSFQICICNKYSKFCLLVSLCRIREI